MHKEKQENINVAAPRKPTVNCLGLCSGVGMLEEGVGFALEHFGLDHRTVGLCEWEGYPAQQLITLMDEGALDPAPVWCGDFADLDWKSFHGVVDAFIAGYPCQAWSSAGKRLGFADKRWVWGHIEHGLSIVRPRFVYLENVRGLISGGGLGATIAGLSRLGYDAEWSTLYASSVGASHQRDRIFIFGFMADSASQRRGTKLTARQQPDAGLRGKGVVNTNGKLHGAGHRDQLQSRSASDASDQMEHRTGKARKSEGQVASKGRSVTSKLVDWAEELLFAPGQNDPRWDQIIRQRPDLAPTLERDVRILVDGLAPILDKRIRTDNANGGRPLARKDAKALITEMMVERERMLRCAGNGVVPAQAAMAYIELMKRAGVPKL